MMDELKPCRICGRKAGLFSFTRKAFLLWKVKYFYVRCTGCKKRTENVRTAKAAIDKWNRWAGK